MAEGTIKRLTDKGFGFIETGTGKDLFFHMSAVEGVRFDDLRQGQRISLSSAGRVGYGESCCRHAALALVSLLLTCTVWDIVMKLTVEAYQ